MVRKGFTLVELMIVILIVAILAAVAIPLMTGRIDAAKWSEAKASMGTIATAIRAFYAEKGANTTLVPSLSSASAGFIGVTTNDLDGTYFTNGAYAITSASVDSSTGKVYFTITCTAADSGRASKPTTPASMQLIEAGAGAYFTP